jgi:hypothetical protein
MSTLTQSQQDTCLYFGIGGALLSATCLIQLLVLMAGFHLVHAFVMTVYIFAIIAYVLLARLRSGAPLLLAMELGLSLAALLSLLISGLFSLVASILFIYNLLVTAILFSGYYYKKLQADAVVRKVERDEWQGKI